MIIKKCICDVCNKVFDEEELIHLSFKEGSGGYVDSLFGVVPYSNIEICRKCMSVITEFMWIKKCSSER